MIPKALFASLQKVVFDGDKIDQWENLTDILEIVAVGSRIKPAHLAGAGTRGITVLAQLESIASAHGLMAHHTPSVRPWRPRPPKLAPALLSYLDADGSTKSNHAADVLWIYTDDSVRSSIERAVAGQDSVAESLGYPLCCVDEQAEAHTRMSELLYSRYWDMANQSVAGVVDLIAADVEVNLDVPIEMTTFDQTLARFPFLQFVCCKSCLKSDSSPAARVNTQLGQLAHALSPAFEQSIRKAAQLYSRGRP